MARRSREGFHRTQTRPEHTNQLFPSIHRQCSACGHVASFSNFAHQPGSELFRLLDRIVCPECGHEGHPIEFPLVEVEP